MAILRKSVLRYFNGKICNHIKISFTPKNILTQLTFPNNEINFNPSFALIFCSYLCHHIIWSPNWLQSISTLNIMHHVLLSHTYPQKIFPLCV